MFDVPLEELFEALEVSGDDITRRFGLVQCDLPYTLRRVQSQYTAEYYFLSIGKTKDFVGLATQMMHLGVYRHIFFSALQFIS